MSTLRDELAMKAFALSIEVREPQVAVWGA